MEIETVLVFLKKVMQETVFIVPIKLEGEEIHKTSVHTVKLLNPYSKSIISIIKYIKN